MQTNPAVEQNKKTLDGPRVRGISPVGKEKVYGGKDLIRVYWGTKIKAQYLEKSNTRESQHCNIELNENLSNH